MEQKARRRPAQAKVQQTTPTAMQAMLKICKTFGDIKAYKAREVCPPSQALAFEHHNFGVCCFCSLRASMISSILWTAEALGLASWSQRSCFATGSRSRGDGCPQSGLRACGRGSDGGGGPRPGSGSASALLSEVCFL